MTYFFQEIIPLLIYDRQDTPFSSLTLIRHKAPLRLYTTGTIVFYSLLLTLQHSEDLLRTALGRQTQEVNPLL